MKQTSKTGVRCSTQPPKRSRMMSPLPKLVGQVALNLIIPQLDWRTWSLPPFQLLVWPFPYKQVPCQIPKPHRSWRKLTRFHSGRIPLRFNQSALSDKRRHVQCSHYLTSTSVGDTSGGVNLTWYLQKKTIRTRNYATLRRSQRECPMEFCF